MINITKIVSRTCKNTLGVTWEEVFKEFRKYLLLELDKVNPKDRLDVTTLKVIVATYAKLYKVNLFMYGVEKFVVLHIDSTDKTIYNLNKSIKKYKMDSGMYHLIIALCLFREFMRVMEKTMADIKAKKVEKALAKSTSK